eukprot:TRINITY_DN34970_c0_g1_i1.p1 TRINITY_DN34970_c0_g1~~TRINITY_DN34970_c0_g1_i1.p1  ORF type:complete len:491 (-),score=62.29 TRINITY_DN34970_c0_g1_i1:271-1683(-)
MPADGIVWVPLSRGEPLPEDVVVAGETKSDGVTIVGRFAGEAGKINTPDGKTVQGGSMHNFWAPSRIQSTTCEVLRCSVDVEWVPLERGQPIPEGAVYAGMTRSDGVNYVARYDGEAGKINVVEGAMHNYWGHYWKSQKKAEILVVRGKEGESKDAAPGAAEPNFGRPPAATPGGYGGQPPMNAPRTFLPCEDLQIPGHWTTTEGVHIVPDAVKIPEFQELLNATWRRKYTRDRNGGEVPTGARVVNVLRVENHENFASYSSFMEDVRSRRGSCEEFEVATKGFIGTLESDVNAMYLFHGTNPQSAEAIAKTDFRIDLAGSAVGTMFGPGLYLAEHASKSDEYAKEGDGIFMGQCALVVCRAIAGKPFVAQDQGNWAQKVASGEFDCVCGDRMAAVGTFREMVFFNNLSVYPEYIVLYVRCYDNDNTPPPPAGTLPAKKAPAPPTGTFVATDGTDDNSPDGMDNAMSNNV